MFFSVSIVRSFSGLKMGSLTFLVLDIGADLLPKWCTGLTTVLYLSELVGMLFCFTSTSIKKLSWLILCRERLLNVINATYKIHVLCSIHVSKVKSLHNGITHWDLPPYRNFLSCVECPFLLQWHGLEVLSPPAHPALGFCF